MMTQPILDELRAIGAGGAAAQAQGDSTAALALLLIHMIEADGIVRPAETARLRQILGSRLRLTPDESARIADLAGGGHVGPEQVAALAGLAAAGYSADALKNSIHDMWDIAFSDGELHDAEEALALRTGDLLGLGRRDAILQQVEAHRIHS
jgi:uncharacterized tellurite resistance protein B-like protein